MIFERWPFCLALLIGCVEYQPGITVEVSVELAQQQSYTQFQTNLGYTIEPMHSHVSLTALELLPCEESLTTRWINGLQEGLQSALIGTAYAHSQNLRALPGAILVEQMATDRQPVSLGALFPAPGRYCQLRVRIGASDPEAPATLYLDGAYLAPGGARALDFTVVNQQMRERVLPLDAPLVVSGQQLEGAVRIALSFARWFDALELNSDDTELLSDRALSNIEASLSATVERQAL